MKSLPLSFKIQLFSGLYVLLCIPLILLAEKYSFSEAPFHLTQLIAIISCFISGLVVLIKGRKGMKATGLFVSGLGVILTGLILAFVGTFIFGPTFEDLIHRRKFDAQVWKQSSDDQSQWPPRLCMVNSLIRSKKLRGLTKSEVVELLGEPAGKGFPFGASSCDIHYYLGQERGFMGIDSEWLFITFGEDGKVNRYWLYTD